MNPRLMAPRSAFVALLGAACALPLLTACSRTRFEIDPEVVTGCAAVHGHVVNVSWDARPADAKLVRIYVLRPGQGDKLWAAHGPVGSKKTGPWASDGLTFIMRDHDERELGRRTLMTSPCPDPQKYE